MNVVRKAMPGIPARNSVDQIFDMRARRFAPHAAEHRFIDMLQRHVDVARDFATLRDRLDQLVAPMRRMRVEQAHPEIAFDIFDLAQKRRQRRPARGIDRLARSGLLRSTNPFRNRSCPG